MWRGMRGLMPRKTRNNTEFIFHTGTQRHGDTVFPCSSVPSVAKHMHPIQIQWHITERCNLRCTHCYQHSFDSTDPPLEMLQAILQRFLEAARTFKKPIRITLTGGEPFLRVDFFDLLDEIATHRQLFRIAILTNGMLIDQQTARRLARMGPDYVQVSLDGMKETHETLRGQGSFNPAIEGIRQLVRAGVRTLISFTASRRNAADFPAVAKLSAELGVHRIWADRWIPNCPEQQEFSLSPEETQMFFESMQTVRQSLRGGVARRICGGTEVAMHRALQFLVGGGTMYHCTAGRSLVAVLPDGTLLPCRRLPIPVGNLMEQSLVELYQSSELFRQLRETSCSESSSCHRCVFAEGCGGGLRCLAFAMTGDPFSGDPGCWMVKR